MKDCNYATYKNYRARTIGDIRNNRYVICDEVGHGGTSRVYLVKDTHLGKCWAMKEIFRDGVFAREIASAEIEMLKAIDYPMFPKIVDAWEEENSLFIVSDYVEGVSLDRILAQGGVGKRQAYKWAYKIAGGLKYLHDQSPPILYLDLKPENIIIKPDGDVAMVDFGIAGRIATHSMPLGTPGYAAPEQYKVHEGNIGVRTDIFAFGMTYFAMRSGAPPNLEPRKTISIIRHINLFGLGEKSFLLGCIAEEYDKRFRNMDEVLERLKHINNHSFKIRNKILFTILLMSAVIVTIFGCLKVKGDNLKTEAAHNMVSSAGKYIIDGDYTTEGIKIITSFINSGCLDETTEREFTFEVAKNLFEIQRDYKTAGYYFGKLDRGIYPEADYYQRLCRLMTRVESSKTDIDPNAESEELDECLEKFYGYVLSQSPSVRKYENMMLIAYCYENCEADKKQGLEKAVTVIESAINEIEDESVKKCFDGNENTIKKLRDRNEVIHKKGKLFIEREYERKAGE